MSTSLSEIHQVDEMDHPLVDCDLHVYPRTNDELVARLPERFQGNGVVFPDGNWSSPIGRFRDDAVPENGTAGSDPDLTGQYLDEIGMDDAIITGCEPVLRVSTRADRRYAAELCRAYNDWLIEEWLEADDRLHGSISVPSIAPEAAAEEIRRVGDHPDVVQVIVGSGTKTSLGGERYWPIYEAAVEKDLPVAIHAGSEGHGVANPNTGAGYPSTYLEMHTVKPANFMGQLLNLVLEGPLVEYPDLRIVMIGGGYSWIPSFLWRIDKCWKGLRDDFPWIERPPSEYVRERFRFVTYPIDETGDDSHLQSMLEMISAEETLLFGSNYPRWNSYDPSEEVPELEPELTRAIFSGTATELYDL